MQSEQDIKKTIAVRRILIPVVLGCLVTCWLLWGTLNTIEFVRVEKGKGDFVWQDRNKNAVIDFSEESEFIRVGSGHGDYVKKSFRTSLADINWTWFSSFALLCALLMMVLRDLAYMWRIRVLTNRELSWKQSFRVIMIWEFASAVTPGVVGGAAVAMFILNREKINFGRSTAIVMITAMLDELFYILIVPVFIFLAGTASLFPIDFTTSVFGSELHIQGLFWLAYGILSFVTVLLFAAVFISPGSFKNILLLLCKLPFLRKLRSKAEKTGDDIILASTELKDKPASFWLAAFGATACSWTARFLVINCIIIAFAPMSDQLIILARQFSMWVLLMISPTPGGTGIAEFVFSGFLNEFIPFGLAGILAVLWRLISYYPYLFIGAFILPSWLARKEIPLANAKDSAGNR